MKILNFGSLNVDHVYRVAHFVRPGETLASKSYSRFAGGKGLNQSMALARAGATVCHAGKLGGDGAWLKEKLKDSGVDTRFTEMADGPCGHAIIQVSDRGENSIILHGGANREIDARFADKVLGHFSRGDFLLSQNEISSIPHVFRKASKLGMKIVFNPAPMHKEVLGYPLDLVDMFIINEIEGMELSGEKTPSRMISALREKFGKASFVLTLGKKGALYAGQEGEMRVPAPKVKSVDTTAAGDTFIGYFLADLAAGREIRQCLKTACRAAAICVTRHGASDSIPFRKELGN